MIVIILADEGYQSESALRHYLANHHNPNNIVHLFHANDSAAKPYIIRSAIETRENNLKVKMENIIKEMCIEVAPIFKWVRVTRSEDVATEALKYADETDAGLLVCGSRNLTTIGSMIFGSVSKTILYQSKCPVLLHK